MQRRRPPTDGSWLSGNRRAPAAVLADNRSRTTTGLAEAAKSNIKKQKKREKNKAPTLLYIFAGAALASAFYAPIQDADEVFNYWEPTHYLAHRTGAQTWEYSPQYAIRSWMYVGLHAAVVRLASLIPHIQTRTGEFYFVRVLLALVYASCQTFFTPAFSRLFGDGAEACYVVAMVSSAGMFHASTALLPSSFAMYAVMIAFGIAAKQQAGQPINWKGRLGLGASFAVGCSLGWPFVAVLFVPTLFVGLASWNLKSMAGNCITAGAAVFAIAGLQAAVDSAFYRTPVFVPWNIVAYNVFGGADHGPDLFGTEPWDFYLRNLLLNFGGWFVFAAAALPLILLAHLTSSRADRPNFPASKAIMMVTPFYLWLAIFTAQPHKEERFMYPAYPLLGLNSALAILSLCRILVRPARWLPVRVWSGLQVVPVAVIVAVTVVANLSRIVRLHTGYFAPMEVYESLHQANATTGGDVVCLGKEWHRFPSSFFLPPDVSVRFVRSDFRGLLPGRFDQFGPVANSGWIPAAAGLIPPGMNHLNHEDQGKYTPLSDCTFLVDSHFPSTQPSPAEPHYLVDASRWERVKCLPYLDSASSRTIDRLVWMPRIITSVLSKTGSSGPVWGEYCLLKQRQPLNVADDPAATDAMDRSDI